MSLCQLGMLSRRQFPFDHTWGQQICRLNDERQEDNIMRSTHNGRTADNAHLIAVFEAIALAAIGLERGSQHFSTS